MFGCALLSGTSLHLWWSSAISSFQKSGVVISVRISSLFLHVSHSPALQQRPPILKMWSEMQSHAPALPLFTELAACLMSSDVGWISGRGVSYLSGSCSPCTEL